MIQNKCQCVGGVWPTSRVQQFTECRNWATGDSFHVFSEVFVTDCECVYFLWLDVWLFALNEEMMVCHRSLEFWFLSWPSNRRLNFYELFNDQESIAHKNPFKFFLFTDKELFDFLELLITCGYLCIQLSSSL